MTASSLRPLANDVVPTSAAGALLGGYVTTDTAALLTPNAPTGLEGTVSLESFLSKGTPEIQHLLRNECDIIFECRFCRNLFRSIITFTAHKRAYCRGSFRALQTATELAPSVPDANIDEEVDNTSSPLAPLSSDPVALGTLVDKKAPPQLRRVNLVTKPSKKSSTKTLAIDGTQHKLDLHTLPRVTKEVPVTEIDNEQQIITTHLASTLALRVAAAEVTKADRTLVVVPSQPATSRICREFAPPENGTAAGISSGLAVLTHANMTVLENLAKWASDVADLTTLRCLNPVCREVPAFESVESLALHITLQHIRRRRGVNRRLVCLLCAHSYRSYKTLRDHLDRDHAHVRRVLDRLSEENPHCSHPYESNTDKASDQPPPAKICRNFQTTAMSCRIVSSSSTRSRVLSAPETRCRPSAVPGEMQHDKVLESRRHYHMVDENIEEENDD